MNFASLPSLKESIAAMRKLFILLVSGALIAMTFFIVGQARFVDAAPAPSMQFPTSAVTTNGNLVGGTRVMAYGATGVTLTETNTAVAGSNCLMGNTTLSGASANVETNVTDFVEPDFPAAAAFPITGCNNGQSRTSSLSFNKGIVAPILHIVNLDASYLDLGGTSTTSDPIGYSTIIKNDAMTLSGNRFNSTTQGPSQAGCKANNGTNPNGACGSFRLTAATGIIKDFTFTNAATSGNDGWYWGVSFPTVPLTKSFSPATITAGQAGQLAFSVSNPNESDAVPLSPLDFTDSLPAGVTIASANTTNNSQCGTPTITDASNAALTTGSSSVKASNISVAVGATCTITVTVTSSTAGTYTNDTSNLSSSVGNVIPNANASLTVVAASNSSTNSGTTAGELANTGQNTRLYSATAAVLIIAGLAVAFRRKLASTSSK